MPEILHAAAAAHLAYFQRPFLLLKFNSFRIPQIEVFWGSTVRYVHVVRDVHETADSMRRNRFEFLHHGRLLTAVDTCPLFRSAVNEHARADRLTTVIHRDLITNSQLTVARILGVLGIAEITDRQRRFRPSHL